MWIYHASFLHSLVFTYVWIVFTLGYNKQCYYKHFYTSSYINMLSFPLRIYLRVKRLGGSVTQCLTILTNCWTISQRGCTILHYHQKHRRALITPQSYQHLLLSVLIINIQMGLKGICGFECISLITNDVEQLFLYVSHLCSSKSLPTKNELLLSFIFKFKEFFIYSGFRPLSYITYFLQFCALSLNFLMVIIFLDKKS